MAGNAGEALPAGQQFSRRLGMREAAEEGCWNSVPQDATPVQQDNCFKINDLRRQFRVWPHLEYHFA